MKLLSRNLLTILFLLIANINTSAYAQPYFSVGPKFGYTWGGSESGFVVGVEVSYFYNQSFNGNTYHSVTLDASVVNGKNFLIHVGYENLYDFLSGFDIGPTISIHNGIFSPGLGVILFAGAALYPFFEIALYPTDPTPVAETVGGYLKFPLANIPGANIEF